jgi:SAM-dependent methyltransferase
LGGGHAAAQAALNRRLADLAAIGPGTRVLDAGCGVGSSARWLVQERQAQVTGLTIVAQQAVQARRYVRGRSAFLCADYHTLPLASGSFDVVWMVESLCHAQDLAQVVTEARRVLRPGGRLVIADRLRCQRPAADEALLLRWLSGWAMRDLATPAEVRAALIQAGFSDVQIHDVTAEAWRALRELGWLAAASLPAMHGLAALRLQNRRQLRAVQANWDQYWALRKGLWGYYLIVGT